MTPSPIITQVDRNRVFDGFSVLFGVNGALAPSLIPINQCAAARDFTFRDGYVRTRSPFANRLFEFDSDLTELHWTGKFQGCCFYRASTGGNGWVISRGGRLFFLVMGGVNILKEITPQLTIATTLEFTVPAPAANVDVYINSASLFTVGDTVFIDSGQYTVFGISDTGTDDYLTLTYVAGAAAATVAAGTLVLDSLSQNMVEWQTNPAYYDFIHIFQAEQYAIVLAGQPRPIFFDGAMARRANTDELPSGVLGIYLWGRVWVVLPDRRSFVAGDLVRGPSGTAAHSFIDSILKMTENDFLNEGGAFTVPQDAGPITSLFALATQDTSLGVGNLLVGTTNAVVSCNTPVDRTIWKNVTYPIQTISLIDYGPQGQRNVVSVNGDAWYRTIDGIRSFIVARRNITTWGNTPMSREVDGILSFDTDSLLPYGSGVLFDNRLLMTVSPSRTELGIIHKGLAVINYDLLSSMTNKNPPAWEGAYSGLNILQIAKGQFNGTERCFAFVSNGDDIELWEVLKSGYYDQFTESDAEGTNITRTAIEPWLETRSYNFGDSTQLKGLYTCELYLDEIVDDVTLTIKFRPDQLAGWTDWTTVSFCANVTQCNVTAPGNFTCQVFKTRASQYAAHVMLTQPPETCNVIGAKPVSQGYEFQFRLEGTGHFRLRGFKPHGKIKSDTVEGQCTGEPVCQTVEDCGTDYFNNYNSHGS